MLSRIISLLLSIVFFVGNGVLAHSAETNLWTERRKNQVVLAQLPTNSPLPSPLLYTPKQAAALQPFASQKNQEEVVLHIQDVHQNEEAQANISATLTQLIEEKKVDLVALEGAFAPLDIESLRNFPYPDAIRTVTDEMLKENALSGPIHAALRTKNAIPLFIGIDDKILYDANVKAVQDSAKLRETVNRQIKTLTKRNEIQKGKILSPELRVLDHHISQYHLNQINLGDYLTFLATKQANLPTEIQKFLRALELEKKISFSKVEAERAQALSHVATKLNGTKSEQLLAASLAFRSGQSSESEFYSFLKGFLVAHQTPLSAYPQLSVYINYVTLSEAIDSEKLFEQIKTLEIASIDQVLRSTDERALMEDTHALLLAQKLIDFSLTQKEWIDYQAARKLLDLSSFERFYENAAARDMAMSKNLVRVMGQYKAKSAVLVTGGFHTKGIAKELEKSGVRSVSFSPKITKVALGNETVYLNSFTQEKTSLEKLFAGEKLFLAKAPLSDAARFNLLHRVGVPLLRSEKLLFRDFQAWASKAILGLRVLSYRKRSARSELNESLRQKDGSVSPFTATFDGRMTTLRRSDIDFGPATVLGLALAFMFVHPFIGIALLLLLFSAPQILPVNKGGRPRVVPREPLWPENAGRRIGIEEFPAGLQSLFGAAKSPATRILAAMKYLNWTKEELGRRTKINTRTLLLWERDSERKPQLQIIQAASKALKISPIFVLTGLSRDEALLANITDETPAELVNRRARILFLDTGLTMNEFIARYGMKKRMFYGYLYSTGQWTRERIFDFSAMLGVPPSELEFGQKPYPTYRPLISKGKIEGHRYWKPGFDAQAKLLERKIIAHWKKRPDFEQRWIRMFARKPDSPNITSRLYLAQKGMLEHFQHEGLITDSIATNLSRNQPLSSGEIMYLADRLIFEIKELERMLASAPTLAPPQGYNMKGKDRLLNEFDFLARALTRNRLLALANMSPANLAEIKRLFESPNPELLAIEKTKKIEELKKIYTDFSSETIQRVVWTYGDPEETLKKLNDIRGQLEGYLEKKWLLPTHLIRRASMSIPSFMALLFSGRLDRPLKYLEKVKQREAKVDAWLQENLQTRDDQSSKDKLLKTWAQNESLTLDDILNITELSKPGRPSLTRDITVAAAKKFLNGHPRIKNWASRCGLPDERFAQLFVAWWYELPWSFLPWFVLMHTNRDPSEYAIRFAGHYALVLFPFVTPFLFSWSDYFSWQLLMAFVLSMAGHLLHNVLFQGYALTFQRVDGRTKIDPTDQQFVIQHQDRLSELTPVYGQILKMRYIDKIGIKEIAAFLQVKKPSALSRIKSALKTLSKLVSPDPYALPELVRKNAARLDELEPDVALLLRGRFLENKKTPELAQQLGISPNTVSPRLRLAIVAFRRWILSDEIFPSFLVRKNEDRLREIPDTEAVVLRMLHLEKRLKKDVAAILGVNVLTVSHRETKGLERLRQLTDPAYLSPAEFVKKHQHRLIELRDHHSEILRQIYLEGKSAHGLAREKNVSPSAIPKLRDTALKKLHDLVASGKPSALHFVRLRRHLLPIMQPPYGLVLQRYFIDGLSLEAMSGEVDIRPSSILSRIRTALKKLDRISTPGIRPLTLHSTIDFTTNWQDRHPRIKNWALHRGLTDERFTQLFVAWWYEFPSSFLPWFALLHINKNAGDALIRLLGHTGFVLFPTAIPFLFPLVDSFPLKILFSVCFNMSGHFLFNLIAPQFALTRINPVDAEFVQKHQARLPELKEMHAKVLRMRFLENKSQTQIATELDVDRSTVTEHEANGLIELHDLISNGDSSPSHLVHSHPDLLPKLRDSYALILRRHYLDGISTFDLAEELGVARSVVQYRISSALEELRLLAGEHLSPSEFLRRHEDKWAEWDLDKSAALRRHYLENVTVATLGHEWNVTRASAVKRLATYLKHFRKFVALNGASVQKTVEQNRELLPRLNPRYTKILTLLYLENRSNKYVALELGVSPSVITRQARLGLRDLQKLILEEDPQIARLPALRFWTLWREQSRSDIDPYWQNHIRHNWELILDGAEMVLNKGTATVMGAGDGTDIPLLQLAEMFTTVHLVDIDSDAMKKAKNALPLKLQYRVHLHQRDISSGADSNFTQAGMTIIKDASTAEIAFANLQALYARPIPIYDPRPLHDVKADYVISSLTATQISRFARETHESAFRNKFGPALDQKLFSSFIESLRERHITLLGELTANPDSLIYVATAQRTLPTRSVPLAELRSFLTQSPWAKSIPEGIKMALESYFRIVGTLTNQSILPLLFALCHNKNPIAFDRVIATYPSVMARLISHARLNRSQSISLIEGISRLAQGDSLPIPELTPIGFEIVGKRHQWNHIPEPAKLLSIPVHAALLRKVTQPKSNRPETIINDIKKRTPRALRERFIADFSRNWEPTYRRNKELIMEGAKQIVDKDVVTILGAGACSDIPLLELAQQFRVVHLLDIDEDALHIARDALPADLREKVHLHIVDITGGVLESIARQGLKIIEESSSGEEAMTRLVAMINSHSTFPSSHLHEFKASYVISSLVLSQFAATPQRIFKEPFQKKFNKPLGYVIENKFYYPFIRHQLKTIGDITRENGRAYVANDMHVLSNIYTLKMGAVPKVYSRLVQFLQGSTWGQQLHPSLRELFSRLPPLGGPKEFDHLILRLRLLMNWDRVTRFEAVERILPPQELKILREKMFTPNEAIELVKEMGKILSEEDPTDEPKSQLVGTLGEYIPYNLVAIRTFQPWLWLQNPFDFQLLEIESLLLKKSSEATYPELHEKEMAKMRRNWGDRFFEVFSKYAKEHINHSHRLILEGANKVTEKRSVTILGAGICKDIPLKELAEQFEAVHLVDINQNHMEAAIKTLPVELQKKVQMHVMDVTGGELERLVQKGVQIINDSATEQEALSHLAQLETNFPPAFNLGQLKTFQSSYVVSSVMATQVANLADGTIGDHFVQKFGASPGRNIFSSNYRDEIIKKHVELIGELLPDNGLAYLSQDTRLHYDLNSIPRTTQSVLIKEIYRFATASPFFFSLDPKLGYVLQNFMGLVPPGHGHLLIFLIQHLIDTEGLPIAELHGVTIPPLVKALLDLTGGARFTMEQTLNLLKTLNQIVQRIYPQAHVLHLQHPYEAYIPSNLSVETPIRTWFWATNPLGFETYEVKAALLKKKSSGSTGIAEQTIELLQDRAPASLDLANALDTPKAERTNIIHVNSSKEVGDLKTLLRKAKGQDVVVISAPEFISAVTDLTWDYKGVGVVPMTGLLTDALGVYHYEDVLNRPEVRGLRSVRMLVESGYKEGELLVVTRQAVPFLAEETLAKRISVLINLGEGWIKIGLEMLLQATLQANKAA